MREIVSSLYAFMLQIDERTKAFDRKIDAIFKANDVCQRIAKIRGIGPTARRWRFFLDTGIGLPGSRKLARTSTNHPKRKNDRLNDYESPRVPVRNPSSDKRRYRCRELSDTHDEPMSLTKNQLIVLQPGQVFGDSWPRSADELGDMLMTERHC